MCVWARGRTQVGPTGLTWVRTRHVATLDFVLSAILPRVTRDTSQSEFQYFPDPREILPRTGGLRVIQTRNGQKNVKVSENVDFRTKS